jgi:endonuclease/exonuclease/phosphatase family metal-dependent hydrolase
LLALGLAACNGADSQETQAVAEDSEAATEKSTKKGSTQKETEPPVALENTEGLDLGIKILSQNLCIGDRPYGSIKERSQRFAALLADRSPDIVGTQEGSFEWSTYLDDMEGYGAVGISSEGKRAKSGEWNMILYKKDRFVLMDSGNFWLSGTPNSSSHNPNSFASRVCTWAELFDTYTGRTVIMVNTRFDNSTEAVRMEQASILVRHLRSELGDRYTQCQIYLTCDLNATYDDGGHTYLYERAYIDARDLAQEDLSVGKGTYHAFGKIEGGKETSFCFHRGNDTVSSYEIVDKSYNGYVSDHYGILVTFEMAK